MLPRYLWLNLPFLHLSRSRKLVKQLGSIHAVHDIVPPQPSGNESFVCDRIILVLIRKCNVQCIDLKIALLRAGPAGGLQISL